ncbi:PD-(D/E)XK nuclease family protein [Actinotalea sp. M2MS4P-6]|uniref:ATP-dependent helicase n=1 Tax=Actinotalea sp. M2MS4P-6 TaxID=2983762 RepID=UPI0021E3CD19|nr:UrvD/REP family ATP-dependent DNA helicase [Actinotalea sp. M2MS4P-6]MCV2396533.1 PD-(D/E)XK nuclease family protein [Actinotalea sp. M2MS4P-6]
MLELVPPVPRAPWPEPDVSQRRVVDHRGPLLVTGAPGSGRSTTALAVIADRVVSGELDLADTLLIAPTRRAAARLRDALSARLRTTTGAPGVRTASSVAFAVLRARASLLGEPTPTLISGPEQDLVLAELLAGHRAGEGARVDWPGGVPAEALSLRAFRDELRDLLMRAAERGLRPDDLDRLGQSFGRPQWSAAATVYGEYLDVTQLRSGTPDAGARYDPAVVVDEATEALAAWSDEIAGAAKPAWRLVVVDDYQEATAATVRLLHQLAADGAELVLLADPDLAVQSFRGASPGLVDRASLPAGSELGAFGADTLVLDNVWRHGARLREVVAGVTAEIRGTQRRHRAAAGTEASGSAEVHVLRSTAQESADVAHVLRSAHLHDGLPWNRMAVLVRSGSQVAQLRRALLAARVPVEVLGSDVPLRAEPAVRPLLTALACVLDPALLADHAATLLTSPIGGLDPVGLRRVRRALRAEELAGGGGRTSDELLVEVLGDPARAATLPAEHRGPVQRMATVLAAGRDAAGDGVLEVLWALWSATSLADAWRRAALAGGSAGARADRDLDAVLTLFTAAEQFVDRLPQAPAQAFLDNLEAQDLPADSLAARGGAADTVLVLTAASAAGLEWDLVVVSGVQEGVWPDLRLRDSMLGAAHLVEVLARRAGAEESPAQARQAVLADELRAFAVATSRARTRLVVTAVRDTDHQPSALVDLVDTWDGDGPDHRVRAVPAALDLRSVVARCRAAVEADPAHPAGGLLAALADRGVEGADPDTWFGTRALSTDSPLWPVEGPVPLSPSKVEQAGTCALRWALESVGGTAAESRDQSLGTLMHAVAAALPAGSEDELRALVDQRWSELGLPDGWLDRQARRRADTMVRKLAAYLATAGEAVAVEEDVRVRLGRVEVRGQVDRLERVGVDADGRPLLRVVDLKTGKNPVSKDDALRHPQLGLYQAALDTGGVSSVAPDARADGATLLYVGTTAQAAVTRDQPALSADTDPHWVDTLVSEVADVVTSAVMCATRNELCRTCPVRRSCPARPEGRVVGG